MYVIFLFQIEEDMDNYVKFKLMGGKKIMKSHVVPHIFDCQPDRKRTFSVPARAAALKRAKRRLVDEAVASCSTTTLPEILQPSVSAQSDPQPITDMAMDMESVDATLSQTSVPLKRDVAVQAHRPVMFRSKAVQCKLNLGVNVSLSPIKFYNEDITKKQETNRLKNMYESPFSAKSSANRFSENDSDSDFLVTLSEARSSHSEESEELSEKKNTFKGLCLRSTVMKLQNRPRLYLGIPDDAYYVFHLLEKYCKIDSMYIFLTLKKIRTGSTFVCLGDDFGTSESNASKIFSKSLPIINKFLRKLIIKPEISFVKSNLPLAFRARYSNVYCIIDCLEIEIEKPSDAVKQSLTWSEYKKCNTLKYLISCTPDGIIHFVSGGFGGRTSDAVVVENSGFLETLPPNVSVMADRGFKHIEHLLVAKGCVLVRPPTVSTSTKPSRDEVLETKRIASLRIHVERVIRRLREFSFLAPHACIDNKLLRYTDNVIKIVCGLINLQSGIISGK